MTTTLLSTTYFGPIQWYQKLYRYDRVLIEQHETFQKQTFRNRCLIATTQGVQALTVPIDHGGNMEHGGNVQSAETSALNPPASSFPVSAARLSSHGNWRHLHWQALQSAYGESPFFEYYEDDLRPFFKEDRWQYLLDFNEAICQTMCELLDIHPNISRTTSYIPPRPSSLSLEDTSSFPLPPSSFAPEADFRETIRPKHPLPDADFRPRDYYQVYRQKHGFLPNLSILDLLFNMGPESIFFL